MKFELKEPIIYTKTLVRYKNIPNSDIYGFIFLNKDLSLKTYLSLEIGYVLDVNQPDIDLGWHRVYKILPTYFKDQYLKENGYEFDPLNYKSSLVHLLETIEVKTAREVRNLFDYLYARNIKFELVEEGFKAKILIDNRLTLFVNHNGEIKISDTIDNKQFNVKDKNLINEIKEFL